MKVDLDRSALILVHWFLLNFWMSLKPISQGDFSCAILHCRSVKKEEEEKEKTYLYVVVFFFPWYQSG